MAQLPLALSSSTYTLNVCASINGGDSLDQVQASVYLMETNEQPFTIVSTNGTLVINQTEAC